MKDRIGFRHAINGIIAVWKSEWNFRFHVTAMLVVIVAGLFFKLNVMEWMFVTIVIAMVLLTEIVNTAIEKMVDYVKPEYHPAAKFIKDAAAGAVLVSVICACIVGIVVFLPKLGSFLF